jgi:hypothetical protein
LKKKLATVLAVQLDGMLAGQIGLFERSKKFEKKACQVLKSLINAT